MEENKGQNEDTLIFRKWFDSKNIPYILMEQSQNTFSQYFKKEKIKRPDILLFLKNKPLMVEIKRKNQIYAPYSQMPRLYFSKEEVLKYNRFEKHFKIPVWFAITVFDYGDLQTMGKYYWITNSRIPDLGTEEKQKERFKMPLKSLLEVDIDDTIAGLIKKLKG